MMKRNEVLEYHRARAIAAEYRSKGYAVIEEPSPEQLPCFLTGYLPDLLLHNEHESVVVEVTARRYLSKEPQIRDLAELLRDRPGWRFELAIVDTGEYLDIPDENRPFDREDVKRRLGEAERLLDGGFPEDAFIAAWACGEAIVRLLAEEEGWSADRPTSSHVFSAAVHYGAISGDDYSFLAEALKHRDALVHGFARPGLNPDLVDKIIVLVRRLLESTPSSAPST